MEHFSIQVDIGYLDFAAFEIAQSTAIEQRKDKAVFD